MKNKVSPTTNYPKEEKILSKYTERLASKRAKAIDDFIGGYIPKWQTKIMLRFPFLVKLFGWEVEHWTKVGDFGTDIKLKRYGKFVAQLTITETINL